MGIFLVILAFILLLIGLIGAVVPLLPGPPIAYIGLLVLQWSGYGGFSVAFLVIWGIITVAVTVMDFILPSLFAKKFGGSRAASIGSFLGLVIGLFVFTPWGLIFGPFVGALIGEWIHNKKLGKKVFKVALGAFLAFFAGTGIKLITSGIMLFYAIMAMF